jgi:uncharacterized protein YkwD
MERARKAESELAAEKGIGIARIQRQPRQNGVESIMAISRHGLVLSLALIVPVLLAQAQTTRSLQRGKQEVLQPEAEQLFALANQARAEAGAAPLKWDAALARAARQHCLRMAAEGPIAHQYAGEPDVSVRAAQAGAHFSLIEENVAFAPTPAAIHDGWMHSPGHRRNLLNPTVDRVGIAVVAGRDNLYAVADYERAVPVLSGTQVEAAVAGLLHGVAILPNAAVARAACAMDHGFPGSKSDAQPRFIMRWQSADLTHLPAALANELASKKFRQAAVGSCPAQGEQDSFAAYRIAVLLY